MILPNVTPYVVGGAAVVALSLGGWGAYQKMRADGLARDLVTAQMALQNAEDNAARAQIARDVWQAHAARMKAQSRKNNAILEEIRNDPDADEIAGAAILRAVERLGLSEAGGDREDGSRAD